MRKLLLKDIANSELSLKSINSESPKRLTPKTNTVRLLLAKSGNQCAFDSCSEVIFNDSHELIAECCHIESALPEGERFNPTQTNEERRAFDNLLFLCHKHHIETNDTVKYTVEILKEIKDQHHRKFSEREILVNPNQVDAIMDRFNEIAHNVIETLNSVKRIESKQDVILEKLEEKSNLHSIVSINEYYDQPATPHFIGRENDILKIETNFESYNTFIIQGVSGIGKSSLVANFLNKIKSHKVLWIDCEMISNLELFHITLSNFFIQVFNDNTFEKALVGVDKDQADRSLIFLLNKYPVCLTFDNFTDDKSHVFNAIQLLNQYLKKSKIIITTTQFIPTQKLKNTFLDLLIKGLTFSEFQKLARQYITDSLDLDELEKLFNLSGGHPYLLKLAALEINFLSANQFFSDFEKDNSSEFEDFIKNQIISDISKSEQKLLLHAIELDVPFQVGLGNFVNDDSFDSTIRSLQKKYLIEKIKNDFYVVSDFLKPTLTKLYKNLSEKENIYNLIDYLSSKKCTVLEKFSLVKLLLKAELNNTANSTFIDLISGLMGEGYFNLVSSLINQLLLIDVVKTWSVPTYVLGRVYRMQGEYQKSLETYNQGIKIGSDSEYLPYFNYEKASILSYLSDIHEREDYNSEAKDIYNKLCSSESLSVRIQSKLALARLSVKANQPEEAISAVKNIIQSVPLDNLEPYVNAQIWQCIGDAYHKNNEIKKAFESFDKSIDYYKEALDKHGMNAFEGLYHLYISYGQTYSDGKDYLSASEMFGINVSIAEKFGMHNKYEQALLDYGYHLLLSEQYDLAIDTLYKYYNLTTDKENPEISELPFLYGCLLFSFWYNGQYMDSIELLGLYINVCLMNNRNPMFAVLDKIQDSEFDIIDMFKKGFKVLIIPDDKTINDFNDWVKEVVSKVPGLESALGNLQMNKNQ